jgi:uncharacterized protein (DUF2384 family)
MSSAVSQLLRDPDETTDLQKLIDEVVPDPETWKQTPNPVLGGQRPLDLLGSPQEQILRDLLRAAKHGMAS